MSISCRSARRGRFMLKLGRGNGHGNGDRRCAAATTGRWGPTQPHHPLRPPHRTECCFEYATCAGLGSRCSRLLGQDGMDDACAAIIDASLVRFPSRSTASSSLGREFRRRENAGRPRLPRCSAPWRTSRKESPHRRPPTQGHPPRRALVVAPGRRHAHRDRWLGP